MFYYEKQNENFYEMFLAMYNPRLYRMLMLMKGNPDPLMNFLNQINQVNKLTKKKSTNNKEYAQRLKKKIKNILPNMKELTEMNKQ